MVDIPSGCPFGYNREHSVHVRDIEERIKYEYTLCFYTLYRLQQVAICHLEDG